jgi:hypothetical protein
MLKIGMEKVANPQVKMLVSDNSFTAKLMQANAGELLLEHLSSTESILVNKKESVSSI